MPKKIIEKHFNEESLKKISQTINEIEKETSGEIRLCVQEERGLLEKNKTPRELAMQEFVLLEMHKTKDRTGVLIHIMIAERKFEIIADEGINKKIEERMWEEIKKTMIEEFRKENFLEGTIFCIRAIGSKLKEHFPCGADDTDELSNDVIIK